MAALPDIDYSIRRSDRARRVRVSVDPEKGVEVVLPRRASEKAARAAVIELRPWIERRLREVEAAREHAFGLPLKLGARQRQLGLDELPALVFAEVYQADDGRVGVRQLDLRVLGGEGQLAREAVEGGRAGVGQREMAGEERQEDVLDERAVNVLAAEVVVAAVFEDAQTAFARGDDGHVEGAAAEV